MRNKKIIALVLILTTILSIFSLPASAAEKIENQITVYYYNENNWKSPYIYYCCDNLAPVTWPGKQMNDFGDGWYSYTINNLKTAKVIFSDNGANQNPAQNQEGYSVEGEKWYKKGTWYQNRPEIQTTKIHYYNENGWSEPYIYYYSDNENPVNWPGTAMNSDGGNWYSFSVNDVENVKVIFSNNGANQNPAQNQEGYSVSGEKWYLNGSWYDSEPNGITVHFNNYNDWDNVNIYYYNGNKTGTSWTGNPMIPDGDGWYTYKIYGFDEAKVLFNNGKGIQIPGQNQEGFAVSGEMWYRNGEWTSERPDDVTVYFYKPDNWSAPNIYYYKDINDTGKAWPGNAMSFVSDNWYSYTITKYSSAKVLFNSGSNQIPPQNQPGFEVKGIVWYKDGVMCNAETDADNDGLPDYMELILGTNLNNKDTDSDGLPDGYEVLTLGTDPLKADTDGNGVKDSNEDADGDKLANLEEYKLGTSPINPDTDGDGLNDYEEVYTYHTDPLNADTDGDTLSDGDDVALGFSPLLKDTDSNGILDCDEKIKQEITQEIKNEEAPQISEVQVSFEGTGNISNTTTIENIYGKDILSSEVVGLIGAPVEITTTSEFENATITFKYDKSRLGDTKEEDLAVMWYDEENGVYQILDNETVLDKEKQTVSYKTTHFSKYMVVDKNIWYNTWRTNIDYREGTTTKLYYDFAFVVDTSGSMSGQSINYAKQSMNNFVDCLADSDNACLVSFASNAYLNAHLGATKEYLHTAINSLNASGGTYVSKGLNMALNQLNFSTSGNQKAIVLICDGDVDSVQSYVNIAKANNIKIFAINVFSADNDKLQNMADETGGEYYYAYTAEELLTAFSHISSESLFNFDLTDTDGDGLPDTFEKNGMRLANGKIVYTEPNKPDTDGDGLTDGEEMGILRRCITTNFPTINIPFKPINNDKYYIGNGCYSSSTVYFNNYSDPTLQDTDGDGYNDCKGENDLKYKYSGIISKGEFGAIKYKGDIYNIVIPDHLTTYITSPNVEWSIVQEDYINNLKFDVSGFISGAELGDTGESENIHDGYTLFNNSKVNLKLGIPGALCGLLSSLPDYVDSYDIKFSFQKSKNGYKRVIISTYSTKSTNFYKTYAGSIPYSALDNQLNSLGKAITSTKIAQYLAELNGKPYRGFDYDMKIYVDEHHMENDAATNLFINSNGDFMETPVIYSKDKVVLGKYEFSSFEILANLKLGGIYKINEEYEKEIKEFVL